MDLRRLRHFVTLVERGNFARAAEALNLTQPALSRSIQSLEDELGTVLLDRHRSGSTPTAAGQVLLNDARAILRQVNTLKRNLDAHARCDLGDVRFGFTPLPATLLLADLLAQLVKDHPRLVVSALVAGATELAAQLQREAIEFFIAPRAMLKGSEAWRIEPFVELPVSLIVRTGHPLADRSTVELTDLQDYPLAAVSPDFLEATGQASSAAFGGSRIAIRCDDYAVLMDLTLNSDVIWIASSALVAKAPGRLQALPLVLRDLPATSDFVAVSHGGRHLSPAANLIIGRAAEIARTAKNDAPPA